MLEFFQTYKNPLFQSALSISLTALIVFTRIPVILLHGLHTYVHPDSPNSGVRAAIRRPDGPDSGPGSAPKSAPELRKRVNKSKDKFEFDETNAQIFRLTLDEAHLGSRLFFREYRFAFTVSLVGIGSLILQMYLDHSETLRENGILESGVFVPGLMAFVAVFVLFSLMINLSFEKSATRRSEKQLGVFFGVLGLALGFMITSFSVTQSVLDFNLGSVDGYGGFCIALLMGCFSGFLFVPGTKNARSFWLGTDQIRSNLSMVTCGWFARQILYASYLVNTFTALLWIKPLSDFLINKNMNESGNVARLLGNVGFSSSDFTRLRLWGFLLSGLLQLVALRPNLQMYLNEALLSWYQRLHASKVPELEYSRAKVFLHNHYLCLVVMQFLVSPLLVLIFLGMSQLDSYDRVGNLGSLCAVLPCSTLDKEVALFFAWWVNFLLSVYTSATLVLFRHGDLCVS